MARGVTITMKGADDFSRISREIKEKFNSAEVQDAILPAGEVVRDAAKHQVNLGPGRRGIHLRDLIFATKGKRATGVIADLAELIDGERGPSVIVGVDRKKAPYAHLVEVTFPFLRPAVVATRGVVAVMIEAAMKRMLAPYSK